MFTYVETLERPHGKGPALYHAKRNFDLLEFAGKANVTKTKNNNEKNKADARRLSSCVDYSGGRMLMIGDVHSTPSFLFGGGVLHGAWSNERLHRQQRTLAVMRAARGRDRRNARKSIPTLKPSKTPFSRHRQMASRRS